MKKASPRKLAFLVSLFISIACVLFISLSFFLYIENHLFLIVGGLIVSFSISYLLIYYALNNFMMKKTEGNDTVQEVNSLVINYSQNRAKEIKKLQRLEKYRKEFLGNVSHELKTPVFNIQGYILTLLDGGLEDPKVNREYLERTEKSINRMISIVEDLESITKLETGELELEIEEFDIVHLIRDIFELQDTIRHKYNIDLNLNRSFDKPIMVSADKSRITEVLNNLIVNSIIYGIRGGKTTVGIKKLDENILVEVADNGIGIEEEEISRIFERFYRADKSRSRDRGGTGLGLSIVKHIIEAHKQTISVRSKIGIGTSFSFTLKKA